MRKSLKIVGLFICVLFIVGCMDAEIGMSIDKDKSLDIAMDLDVDMLEYMKIYLGEGGAWEQIKKEIVTNTCKSSSIKS